MEAKWLSDLESQVESAVTALQRLRKENAAQKRKIKQLEKKLTDAQSTGESSAAWEQERDEIRKRVEKLSAGLEKLL